MSVRSSKVSLVVGGALMIVLAAAALAQFPITAADTATSWLFGEHHSQPNICVTSTANNAVDADGRVTSEVFALINEIPASAELQPAIGWVLWRLAHHNSQPGRGGGNDVSQGAEPSSGAAFDSDSHDQDYVVFAQQYRRTADKLTVHATAVDVVETMDSHADYSPYLVIALAGGYKLLRDGALTATDVERAALLRDLGAACRRSTTLG